jgi:ATP-dependent Lon protease
MVYKGLWQINTYYNVGDTIIKYIYDNYGLIKRSDYYKCNYIHLSDNLTGPWSDEEIYWTKIDIIKSRKSDIDKSELYKSDSHKSEPKPIKLQLNRPKLDKIILKNLKNPIKKNKELKVEIPDKSIVNKSIPEPDKPNPLELEKFELKRKLRNVERELEHYNKKIKMEGSIKLTIEERILLLNVDISTKSFLIDKYESLKNSRDSDYTKGITWLKTVVDLPFNNFYEFKIKKNDSKKNIIDYFNKIRLKLDELVYGLDDPKDEILEFLARKITNPDGKGHILALQGSAGVGKTKILKALGEALEIPFHQINFGGMNDGSILTGHSETYVGSKPGKIVEILTKSKCMNSIIYLDEIDKIAEKKEKEINGILTHILDEQQNDKFQDNYLSNINIDLSKVFFVIAFNDIDKVNPIVLDRMKIIKIKNPSIQDKIIITRDKLIPQIKRQFNNNLPDINNNLIEYIINNKITKQDGVRNIKKSFEKIYNKINYFLLLGKGFEINKEFVDSLLNIEKNDKTYEMMYI